MSVIATIDVAAEDFTLGGALAPNPGMRVRLERVIPVGSTFVPYFWVTEAAVGEVEGALRDETDIESFKVVDTVDDDVLVRVEWGGLNGFLDAMTETRATLLEAVGEDDTWTIQLRFDDHDDLTAFYRQCVDRDIAIDMQNVHNPGLPSGGFGLGITETQRETLVTALERGYYEVPRRINLVDLADEIGVSDTAVSQRLRRGIAALLVATLPESRADRDADDG